MNYSDLINIVTDVGYLLMENGAEIYRVEESMQRLFRAYGVQGSDVYAIPNCITVTICALDGKPLTKIKRIPRTEPILISWKKSMTCAGVYAGTRRNFIRYARSCTP